MAPLRKMKDPHLIALELLSEIRGAHSHIRIWQPYRAI